MKTQERVRKNVFAFLLHWSISPNCFFNLFTGLTKEVLQKAGLISNTNKGRTGGTGISPGSDHDGIPNDEEEQESEPDLGANLGTVVDNGNFGTSDEDSGNSDIGDDDSGDDSGEDTTDNNNNNNEVRDEEVEDSKMPPSKAPKKTSARATKKAPPPASPSETTKNDSATLPTDFKVEIRFIEDYRDPTIPNSKGRTRQVFVIQLPPAVDINAIEAKITKTQVIFYYAANPTKWSIENYFDQPTHATS